MASKEWIIRQYDHEVQGRTVIKPLVGVDESGPGDAAVIQPVRGSTAGLSISCGINPRYGEHDPYAMAMACVDEAIRNAVCVGADPDRIALLDNFCWGNPERPETLGSLVMAAKGCHDAAIGYGAPFISGKDSLYNEYEHEGTKLAIPPTLLISAIGRVPDVRKCVTMDLKEPGNFLATVGATHREIAGSLWAERQGGGGRFSPRPEPAKAIRYFRFIHRAIAEGLVRSVHDLSEGGLAVALAEMCLAGGLGAEFLIASDPRSHQEPGHRGDRAQGGEGAIHSAHVLFSETPSRFIVEYQERHRSRLKELSAEMIGLPGPASGGFSDLVFSGVVRKEPRLVIREGMDSKRFIDVSLEQVVGAWKRPLHASI